MADKFAHADAGGMTTGMTPAKWVEKFYTRGHPFVPSDLMVEVLNIDGTKTTRPINKAAIIFSDLQQTRGQKNAWRAKNISESFVPFDTAMLNVFDEGVRHPLVPKAVSLIHDGRRVSTLPIVWPIGVSHNSAGDTIYQQSARMYVRGGVNDGHMSLENVFNTSISIIQSLVWKAVNDPTKIKQSKSFYQAALVARSFYAGMYCRHPVIKKLVHAMIVSRITQDMGHRSIAFAISAEYDFNIKTILELMQIVVSRSTNHSKGSLNFLENGFGGLMLVLVAIPLLRHHLHGDMPLDAMQNRFEEFYMSVVIKCTTYFVDGSDTMMANTKILKDLLQFNDIDIPEGLVHEFLVYMKSRANARKPFPWHTHGILPPPPPEVTFPLDLGSMKVTGGHGSKTHPVSSDVEGMAIRISPGDATNWGAFQIIVNGTYIINIETIGVAGAARGDSRGRELTANAIFTSGRQLMKNPCGSYSIAGMNYDGHSYIKRTPLDITKKIKLVYRGDVMEIYNKGAKRFEIILPDGEKPMIGLKNATLLISKHHEPVVAAVAVLPPPAPVAVIAIPDLGPEPTAAEIMRAARDLARMRVAPPAEAHVDDHAAGEGEAGPS
jgi:hypothetical protein